MAGNASGAAEESDAASLLLGEFIACLARSNDSSASPGTPTATPTPNGTANATCGHVNSSLTRARPKEMDAFRILLYALIFVLSVAGNLLIVVVLAVNRRMRTVTNCFLLSLALSDLTMALFCMPFTLIPNVMEDFVFGTAMCKIVAYFMGISVSISTFSLVAIAIERYSAICNPLQSRAWQTRSHAYRVIAATWALSLAVMLPYPVFSRLRAFPKTDGSVGHMCRLHWPSEEAEQTWYVLLLLTLFFVPGVVMATAYGLISRELYRGIQFEVNNNPDPKALTKNGGGGAGDAHPPRPPHHPDNDDDNDGCYIQVHPKTPATPPTTPSSLTLTPSPSSPIAPPPPPPPPPPRPSSSTTAAATDSKWRAKRRVIRMLTVVVLLFFLCWMPLYAANTWRALAPGAAHRALSGAPISFVHLLSYSSACVNPLVYCFMNARFRGALLATCCPRYAARRRRGGGGGAGGGRGGGGGGGGGGRRRFGGGGGRGGGVVQEDRYTSSTIVAGGGGLGGGGATSSTSVYKVSYTAVSTGAGMD